jgi:hypothetical protein
MKVLCMAYIYEFMYIFFKELIRGWKKVPINLIVYFTLLVLIMLACKKFKCGNLLGWGKHIVVGKHEQTSKELLSLEGLDNCIGVGILWTKLYPCGKWILKNTELKPGRSLKLVNWVMRIEQPYKMHK